MQVACRDCVTSFSDQVMQTSIVFIQNACSIVLEFRSHLDKAALKGSLGDRASIRAFGMSRFVSKACIEIPIHIACVPATIF